MELIVISISGVIALWIALAFKAGERKAAEREEQRSRCESDNHDYKWSEWENRVSVEDQQPLELGTCTGCGYMISRKIRVKVEK